MPHTSGSIALVPLVGCLAHVTKAWRSSVLASRLRLRGVQMPDTQLTISGFYQRDPKGGYFNSLYPQSLAPAAYRPHLNRSLNIGDPGFERFEREQSGIGYVFDRRLNDIVSVHSALRYSKIDTDMRAIQMMGPITAAGTIPRAAIGSTESADGLAADNRLRFDFGTSGVDHTVLLGVDQQNSRSSWLYQFGAATSLDVVNPAYYQPVGTLLPFINNDQTLSQTGVYVQDQIRLVDFRLTFGTRHDWTDKTQTTGFPARLNRRIATSRPIELACSISSIMDSHRM